MNLNLLTAAGQKKHLEQVAPSPGCPQAGVPGEPAAGPPGRSQQLEKLVFPVPQCTCVQSQCCRTATLSLQDFIYCQSPEYSLILSTSAYRTIKKLFKKLTKIVFLSFQTQTRTGCSRYLTSRNKVEVTSSRNINVTL